MMSEMDWVLLGAEHEFNQRRVWRDMIADRAREWRDWWESSQKDRDAGQGRE